jgi:hypothetical protein
MFWYLGYDPENKRYTRALLANVEQVKQAMKQYPAMKFRRMRRSLHADCTSWDYTTFWHQADPYSP